MDCRRWSWVSHPHRCMAVRGWPADPTLTVWHAEQVQNKYQGVQMAFLGTSLDIKTFWTRAPRLSLLPPNSTPLPHPVCFPPILPCNSRVKWLAFPRKAGLHIFCFFSPMQLACTEHEEQLPTLGYRGALAAPTSSVSMFHWKKHGPLTQMNNLQKTCPVPKPHCYCPFPV